MTVKLLDWLSMRSLDEPLMARPRTVDPSLPVEKNSKPEGPVSSTSSTALMPAFSGFVLTLEPGCVYPSMTTGPVMSGSTEVSVIVCTPAPGMLNAIVSGPAAALASSNAWRKLPAPESLVFVTVNAAPRTGVTKSATSKARQEVQTRGRSMC